MNTTTGLVPPKRITTYEALDDKLFELFDKTLYRGPGAQRVLAVARLKYQTLAEQTEAITAAALPEFETASHQTSMQTNLSKFRQEMRTSLRVREGDPIPFLEQNRPDWADRFRDNAGQSNGDPMSPEMMCWHSDSVRIPARHYNGFWDRASEFLTADLSMEVRQRVGQDAPRIAFLRHAWTRDGDAVNDLYHEMTLDEASLMVKALLLLLDLASGADDQGTGAVS